MSSIGERYLAYINHPPPRKLDLATLCSLLAAHQQAIPFENVTSFLGEPVSLEPEVLYAKLLGGRGGYCMEHQALSYAALQSLGYKCELVLARVYVGPGSDRPLAQTHGGVIVTIGEHEYLYDCGFGKDTPRIPLCITSGDEVQLVERAGRTWEYRIVEPESVREQLGRKMGCDAVTIIEMRMDGEWKPMYGLTRRPVEEVDIDAFNWYISTCPASFFTTKLCVARQVGDALVTGFARDFKRREGESVVDAQANSVEDVDFWLRKQMKLDLSDEQIARVWDKLKTLEHEETDQL